jgi:hypothetical protein
MIAPCGPTETKGYKMPVDQGNPGAASKYYGTGQSEERIRGRRDRDENLSAYYDGDTDPRPYNGGLEDEGANLIGASRIRTRALRRTQER